MKTKIIPFDLAMAEKIQAGEIAGAIKTRKGLSVKMLRTNMKATQCVTAVVKLDDSEFLGSFYASGKFYWGSKSSDLDLVLEVPDEPQKSQFNSSYSIEQLSKLKEYTEQLMEVNQGVIDDLSNMIQELRKICNLSLKTKFKIGDKVSIGDYNEEGVEIYTIVKIIENLAFLNDGSTIPLDDLVLRESKHEFKPFDKVLVRDLPTNRWFINLFSHYGRQGNKITYNCMCGDDWIYCIPYEGNEHLVGTTDKPKEE